MRGIKHLSPGIPLDSHIVFFLFFIIKINNFKRRKHDGTPNVRYSTPPGGATANQLFLKLQSIVLLESGEPVCVFRQLGFCISKSSVEMIQKP